MRKTREKKKTRQQEEEEWNNVTEMDIVFECHGVGSRELGTVLFIYSSSSRKRG